MNPFQSKCLAVGLGALTLVAGVSFEGTSAQAQYGRQGYDRPAPSYDDDDDDDDDAPSARGGYGERRRAPRSDYDQPRRRDYDEPRGGGRTARGGYVDSCIDIRQEGPYLEATCRRAGGGTLRTRIDTRTCRSIGNNNGRLVCE